MPKRLRRFFYKYELRTHFLYALAAGAVLRFFSAIFVYGPQALDDYKHGVWPAYQFFAGLPIDLPEYRSHLLVWFLGVFVHVASWFGFESALAQVRAMYLGLGLSSLLAIYGTYLYVRNFKSRIFGASALYLMAAFPLMPFISTRAFGEAVAMSLVVLAFGYLESARRSDRANFRYWFIGFAVLGLATLFRFHVGVLYLCYLGLLVWRKEWMGVRGALAAGVLTTGAAALVDVLSGKDPLATLFIYLAENEGGGAKYGVSPWYNPWLFVLGVTLAPFSFVLWRQTRALWREHWPMIVPLLVFVTAHSIVAHKEERFLYPILGLEIWAIAYVWSSGAFNRYARRIYSNALFVISLLVLPIVCFVNTQEGEIEPPAVLESRYGAVAFLDYESLFGKSRFQFYFLRPPSVLETITPEEFVAPRVDQALSDHPDVEAVAFLTSDREAYDRLRALERISTLDGRCLQVQRSGSIMDRLLFAMNPRHNQRRRPTWYLVCERMR